MDQKIHFGNNNSLVKKELHRNRIDYLQINKDEKWQKYEAQELLSMLFKTIVTEQPEDPLGHII